MSVSASAAGLVKISHLSSRTARRDAQLLSYGLEHLVAQLRVLVGQRRHQLEQRLGVARPKVTGRERRVHKGGHLHLALRRALEQLLELL